MRTRAFRRHQTERHMWRRLKEDRNQHYRRLDCPCWTDPWEMARFKEQPKTCGRVAAQTRVVTSLGRERIGSRSRNVATLYRRRSTIFRTETRPSSTTSTRGGLSGRLTTGPPAASASAASWVTSRVGSAEPPGVVEHEAAHALAQILVELVERLVEQQRPRLGEQGAHQGDARALAARQGRRVALGEARRARPRAAPRRPWRRARRAAATARGRANARFSPTDRCGNSMSSWNRMPSRRRSGGSSRSRRHPARSARAPRTLGSSVPQS